MPDMEGMILKYVIIQRCLMLTVPMFKNKRHPTSTTLVRRAQNLSACAPPPIIFTQIVYDHPHQYLDAVFSNLNLD